ncbi:MAG: alpha/beta hydrolase [Alphaproteobacteria bacterium]|nr:MAG: alpha/beta hydrolase [Alphaproteobacteria bacterium]
MNDEDRKINAVHPDVAAILHELGGQAPLRRPYEVEQLRERSRFQLRYAAQAPDMARVEESVAGASAVPLRIFTPANDRGSAVVLYFHGGGWVTGQLDLYDAQLRLLADAAAAKVIGVGYRPAPEYPYPSAEHDADAALSWAVEHYGASRRIVIAGDSSGGYLVAGLTQRATAAGSALALQVLIYPILDRETTSWSFERFSEGGVLNRELMTWYWAQYLGPRDVREEATSPLRTTELAMLPPTLIVAAGEDVLVAQNRRYAARLIEAGVDTTYLELPDMVHGYLRWTGRVAAARDTVSRIGSEIIRTTCS